MNARWKAQLVRPNAAPYVVRWVRRFLARPASNDPLIDRVRLFCQELARYGGVAEWQVLSGRPALRTNLVNFLKRRTGTDDPTGLGPLALSSPLTSLDLLRTRKIGRARNRSARANVAPCRR